MKTSLLPFAGALTVSPQAENIPQPPSKLAQGDSAFCAELDDAILKEADLPQFTTATEAEVETEPAPEKPDLEDASEEPSAKEIQVVTWCYLPPVEAPITNHVSAPEVQNSASDIKSDSGASRSVTYAEAPLAVDSESARTGSLNRLDALLPVTPEMAAAVQKAPEPSKPAVVPPENAAGQGGANCPPREACSEVQEDPIPASATPSSPTIKDLLGPQTKELSSELSKALSEAPMKTSEMPAKPTEKLEERSQSQGVSSKTEISAQPQAPKTTAESHPAKAQLRAVESSGTLVAPRDARMNLPETKQMSVEPTATEAALVLPSEFSLKGARTQTDRPGSIRTESYQVFIHPQEAPSDLGGLSRIAEPMDLQDVPQSTPVRLVQSIMHEVSALKTLKGSAMSVVLKPDSETQLSVRLEYREGGIEASATCEKGDFALLQSQWPDLRRALESQGVRLGDLDRGLGGNTSFQQGAGDSSRKQSQADPSREDASFLHGLVNKPLTTSPRLQRVANSSRLLESWA